jgi:hypothetical protein
MREHILTNRDVLVRALAADGEETAADANPARAREV